MSDLSPDPSPVPPSDTIALTRALLHLKMHRNALEQAVRAMRKNIEFANVKDETALAFGIRASLFALRELEDDKVLQEVISTTLEPAPLAPTPLEPSLTQQNSRESIHQPSASTRLLLVLPTCPSASSRAR